MSGHMTSRTTDFQGMPNLGVPMVTEIGTAAQAWYRFFVSLYNVTLAGLPILPTGVVPGNPNSLTLASVSGAIVNQQGQINSTTGNVAANTSSIASLQTAVIALQQEDDGLQVQINGLKAQVDGLTITGTSGGGAPPATASAFLNVTVNGAGFRIPLY